MAVFEGVVLLKMMRNRPPVGSGTPSLNRPAPRKPSSMRETERAF